MFQRTAHKKEKMKIMTHLVAGYPNLQRSRELIDVMLSCGVDYIEVQIPFSDPLGDGPTIMRANHLALEGGMTVEGSFAFISQVSKRSSIPIVVMTYANIPFKAGFRNFIAMCLDAGAQGMIIPDLPYDEDAEDFFEQAQNCNMPVIPVVSPQTSSSRLKAIAPLCKLLVYSTLKVGITGSRGTMDSSLYDFLLSLRQHISVPIAGGFGISSAEQIKQLAGYVDITVIGSHIIRLLEGGGLPAVEGFLRELDV